MRNEFKGKMYNKEIKVNQIISLAKDFLKSKYEFLKIHIYREIGSDYQSIEVEIDNYEYFDKKVLETIMNDLENFLKQYQYIKDIDDPYSECNFIMCFNVFK